jgi:hypothetical protein
MKCCLVVFVVIVVVVVVFFVVIVFKLCLQGSDGLGTKLFDVMSKARSCSDDDNQLFSEASGDFQLLDRSSWHHIRGYMERNTYAHFDSVLIYQARKLGFKRQGFFTRESGMISVFVVVCLKNKNHMFLDPTTPYLIWHQGHEEGAGKSCKSVRLNYDAILEISQHTNVVEKSGE